MTRAFFILISATLLLGACTQRMICPAYQSAFIYDKDALRKKFSYFQEDSTPKILTASKNKYLIAEAMPYRKKLASMATVEMKDVNPVVPDSLTMDGDVSLAELDRAARSIIDSTYIVDIPQDVDSLATEEDSVYMITKDKELRYLRYNKDSIVYRVENIRMNVDQDNYMWYLRDWLILPDVKLAQAKGERDQKQANKKERKGVRGFFKNLFKKKEKVQDDTTAQVAPIEKSEFDFDYGDDIPVTPPPSDESPKKKGIFSFLKKDKNKTKAPKEPKPEKQPKVKKEKTPKQPKEETPVPEEKKKEDGDGF